MGSFILMGEVFHKKSRALLRRLCCCAGAEMNRASAHKFSCVGKVRELAAAAAS